MANKLPMIDMPARTRLAGLIRQLVAGLITNDQFEDRLPRSEDPAVHEVFFSGIWGLYSDLYEYRLVGKDAVPRAARRDLARHILFLGGAIGVNFIHATIEVKGQRVLMTVHIEKQRTAVVRGGENTAIYTYDAIGQVIGDQASEGSGGATRWNEQLHYGFDAAGNLNYRTNNVLIENFQVNNLNELTANTNGGRLTVVGTTTSQNSTVVTVNSSASVSPEWHLDKKHVFILTHFRRLCGSGCGGIFLDKTFAAWSTRGRVWAAA